MENQSKKALIIGLGSIGLRHQDILKNLGLDVFTLSKHQAASEFNFHEISEELIKQFSYIVIANSTHLHYEALLQLQKLSVRCPVLIEKPLFHENFKINLDQDKVFVAYQLRLHPAVQELKKLLQQDEIISANVYVGQDLKKWRRSRPYHESYSAHRSAGGGVLRDLSHELDYVNFLLGQWQSLVAVGGHFNSDLMIDSDDVYSILMRSEKCPVITIELNYLDQCVQRRIILNGKKHTYIIDFIKGELIIDQDIKKFDIERNDLYVDQHKAILSGQYAQLCNFSQGMEVVRQIEAIEDSNRNKKWVSK